MIKPTIVLVHFRKHGIKQDRPWTIHYRGQCIPAETVTFKVPTATVFKPNKKTNPRAWIRAKGIVSVDENGAAVVEG